MAETYYQITQNTPYFIELEVVRNLEDATDVTYSIEEIKELFGIVDRWYGSPLRIKETKVKEVLTDLKQQIKEKGKKTILIQDQELVDFFTTSELPVSLFVDGLRRVGNRLFLHEKTTKTEPNKRDYQALIVRGAFRISYIYNLTLEFRYLDSSKFENAINIIQKLLTFEQFLEFSNEDQRDLYEKIWNNPSKYTVKDEENT
jgi:hypothetical protein